MSTNILNEGYAKKKKLLFESGYKDFIYSNKKKFIDLGFCSGANILGHNLKFQNKILRDYINKKISNFSTPNLHAFNLSKELKKILPNFSKFIFCNSGSEANIKALRIARAITNKSKVVATTGSWHGSVDQFLFKSNKNNKAINLSDGIGNDQKKNLIFIPYNDILMSKKILDKNKKKISCIFIEPIQGCLPNIKIKKYLEFISKYCKKNKIILIFDEMITGVRSDLGSAQKFFNIKTDISTFGKAFANGMPIGFVAITKEIEKKIKKQKLNIYFGGTFSGNSMTTFFAREYLIYLRKNKKKVFNYLNNISKDFEDCINSFCLKNKIDAKVYRYFSMIRLVYSSKNINDRESRDFFETKKINKIEKFKSYLLKNRIYYPNNGIIFFSFSSTKKNYKYITQKFKVGLKNFL
jgi:glutamate-1-semialdehyde aminotransferase